MTYANNFLNYKAIHLLAILLGTPVHLHLRAMIQTASRVAAAQHVKSCRYAMEFQLIFTPNTRIDWVSNTQQFTQNGAKTTKESREKPCSRLTHLADERGQRKWSDWFGLRGNNSLQLSAEEQLDLHKTSNLEVIRL